ncbi:MAG: protein kinase [Kofleriaceae bacterium]
MPGPEPLTGPRKLAGERFELLEKLGEGGMGVVYRALDRERGVQVALKTLRGATPDGVLRFKTEFRSLRDIRHPNLVELGELFEAEGTWFFTMELVHGAPLLAWIRGRADDHSPAPTDSPLLLLGDDVATVVNPAQEHTSTTIIGDSERAPAMRPGPRADEPKLRTALAGLASGLAALHAAGKIHRDVKPSNVLVDASGRAVLLDFGVVAELRQATFEDQLIIGTVNYMAPEQARGDAVGPAADWYALGVVLFQALTGRLPLAAASHALLVLKQHTAAPEVSRFVDAPPDLARLCMLLLEREPDERPTEAQIFELLGARRTEHDAAWMPAVTEGRLFVGRRVELGLLEAALDASARAAVAIVVEGESGVGKTALVDHFCELARATHKKSTILRGRCHQRERVAFNAFDGIVHELARWLISRPDPKVAAIVPERVSELTAVFPDLRAVPMFAAALATDTASGPRDSVGVLQTPADLRDRAFIALRELLSTMAHRGPIVLVIDDLQWADADSLAALEVLLGGAHAPPVLVLATLRSGATMPALAADTRELALGGLAPIDAEKLLHRLASDAGVEDRDDTHLIAESNGHPLFLAELVRHQSRSGPAPRLDDAIWTRAAALDPEARRMLATIAIAGAELSRDLALDGSGLSATAAEAALDRLARAQLIKIHGPRRSDPVEPFHDRVREAVLANESADSLKKLHLALGLALEERGAAADVLWSHFEAAGDRPRATRYVLVAAAQAVQSFAFGRAVELYRHVLAVLNPHARQRSELLAQLADALSMTGHTAEAAKRYLEASSLVEPDSDRQLDLLRRASERFLMSGNIQPGLETARQVLARVGMSLPNSKVRTLAGIGWSQIQTRSSALVWKPRVEVDPRSLRADVCWSIAAGLAMVDTLLGAYYSGRAAVLALRYGTSFQIARSLAAATVGAALMGQRKRTQRCLEACHRAAEEAGSPIAQWYARTTHCTTVFLLDHQFRRCQGLATELEREWHAAGYGEGWETDIIRHFNLASQQMLGMLAELSARVEVLTTNAARMGDKFQEVSLRVRFAIRHLLVDRPETAHEDVVDALAAWQPSAEAFGNQSAWALWTRTRVMLYQRDFGRMHEVLDADWQRMRRALIGRVPALKIEWFHAYGTYLLGRAIDARDHGRHFEAAALTRTCTRLANALDRMRFPGAPATARMLEAGIACVRGGDVVTPLRIALEAALAAEFLVYTPFLRRRLGEAIGGGEGSALIAAGDAEAIAQGWRLPERGAELCIPRG